MSCHTLRSKPIILNTSVLDRRHTYMFVTNVTNEKKNKKKDEVTVFAIDVQASFKNSCEL